jgi:hypothetical protein
MRTALLLSDEKPCSTMTVTFVTAFLDLHETRAKDKTNEARINYFNQLVATGIRLHVFVSPEHRDKISITNGVIETISLEELDFYAISPQGLPDTRSDEHDTRNFLILMNAKIEFMKRAIQAGDSTHYAWADFNLYHVLKDPQSASDLRAIASGYLPSTCMFFPGCWPKGVLWDAVNWRFCGGFFLGDRESLLKFYDLYVTEYPRLPKLTWEVNTWAYLETLGFPINWYSADHRPSILHIPRNVVVVPPDIPYTWASPDCGLYIGGPLYRFVLDCIRSYAFTAIFPKSDGVIGDEEYDRMIASLGREDGVTTSGREYARIAQLAHPGTRPIVCMHSSRSFKSKSLLLMPWSDTVFENGLNLPQLPWAEKRPSVVWRGGSSGFYRPSIRMQVVERLYGVPHTDVRFTRGGWPINDNIIPDHHFGERMTTAEQIQFKYILVIDGNTPASNGQWAFATGSVPIIVTHPGNRWWADSELCPMVNYVPVHYDLSDLLEKIQWLVEHDDQAHMIALNALALSKRVFSPDFQMGYISNRVRQIVQQDH